MTEKYQPENPTLQPESSSGQEARELSPAVKTAIDEAIADMMDLLSGYADINQRARNGEAIAGADFLAVESRFNRDISLTVEDLLKESPSFMSDMAAANAYVTQKMPQLLAERPEILTAFNTEPLDRAFIHQRVLTSPYHSEPHRENTDIPEDMQSEKALVETLLANNRGIAVGDVHTEIEARQFLTRNMATFKACGVDTIYIEASSTPPTTDEQLQLLIESQDTPEEREAARAFLATHYKVPVEQVEEVVPEYLNLIQAAREHGIRVVNIDKTGVAREVDINMLAHRVASTNFIWTDNIEADRQVLREETGKEGKFITFGGAAHYMSRATVIGTPGEEPPPSVLLSENGMVDEGLGVPLLAFRAGAPAPFVRGTNPNGADFYLPASEGYLNLDTRVTPEWYDSIAELAKPPEPPSDLNMWSTPESPYGGESWEPTPPPETPLPPPSKPARGRG